MRGNSKHNLTRVFEEIFENHPELRLPSKTPDWFREDILNEIWLQPNEFSDFQKIISEIWQIHDEVYEVLPIKEENANAPTDLLAYYLSFRNQPNKIWGIHFNLAQCFTFNSIISKLAHAQPFDTFQAVMYYILQHEKNHYEIDLATLHIECFFRTSFYSQFPNPCLDEEALGDARGVSVPQAKKFREILIQSRANSGLLGYQDLGKYLSLSKQRNLFDEIINSNVGIPAYTSKSKLSHQFMSPKGVFSSKNIPLYFHWTPSQQTIRQTTGVEHESNFVVLSIIESEEFQRKHLPTLKKDKVLQKKYESAKKKILIDSKSKGIRLKKWHSGKNLIEARIDRGYRMILREVDAGNYEIVYAGNHIDGKGF